MVLAIATLFFQFAPTLQAIPAAAATAARAYAAEPGSLLMPDADVDARAVKAASSETNLEASTSTSSSGTSLVGAVANPAEVAAQNTEALSLIRIPEPILTKSNDSIGVERFPSRSKWIALSVAQHAAAAFDAYSTRDAISHGAIEADPLMRPFANSSGIYAAIQVLPVALDYTARRMQRSPNNFVRRIWWVPQSAATASYVFSGVHNLHVAGER
jgi:hypothetical protein